MSMRPSSLPKKQLGVLFLTLFLDLAAFSIMFPLFPAILEFYLSVDADNRLLTIILDGVHKLQRFGDDNGIHTAVLFGGLLGSAYSIVQFLFSYILGTLSDRIGRKPVLMISVAGMALSHLLWFFSSSFSLFIVARLMAGMMGGNIATASAAAADLTPPEKRSAAMGLIGAAFGIGFVLGPAMGGLMYHFDLGLSSLNIPGINPFSSAALLAFSLSIINVIVLKRYFHESLPESKEDYQPHIQRTLNPFHHFRSALAGIARTHWVYFIYFIAFSGMEFTIPFLAVERLNYTPMQNAIMFVYIGFIIAVVQGVVVRKLGSIWDERHMGWTGFALVAIGFIGLAYATSQLTLFIGLGLTAIGGALCMPALTSLISLYTPENQQGRTMGSFRAAGSIARAIGPLGACLCYWQLGSAMMYWIISCVVILAFLVSLKLPSPKQ